MVSAQGRRHAERPLTPGADGRCAGYRSLRRQVLIKNVRIDPVHIPMNAVVTDEEEERPVRRERRAVRIFSFGSLTV
jgi:hypothetical protein